MLARLQADKELQRKALESVMEERAFARRERDEARAEGGLLGERLEEVVAGAQDAIHRERDRFEAMQMQMQHQSEECSRLLGTACAELVHMKHLLDDSRASAAAERIRLARSAHAQLEETKTQILSTCSHQIRELAALIQLRESQASRAQRKIERSPSRPSSPPQMGAARPLSFSPRSSAASPQLVAPCSSGWTIGPCSPRSPASDWPTFCSSPTSPVTATSSGSSPQGLRPYTARPRPHTAHPCSPTAVHPRSLTGDGFADHPPNHPPIGGFSPVAARPPSLQKRPASPSARCLDTLSVDVDDVSRQLIVTPSRSKAVDAAAFHPDGTIQPIAMLNGSASLPLLLPPQLATPAAVAALKKKTAVSTPHLVLHMAN